MASDKTQDNKQGLLTVITDAYKNKTLLHRIKRKISRVLIEIFFYFQFLLTFCRYILYSKTHQNRAILVHSYVKSNFIFNFSKHNWGDDLNKYLIETITDKKVFFVNNDLNRVALFSLPQHYLFIGSIITFYNLNNSIMYGTGVKSPNASVVGKPKKIVSVRGPKTREYLISQGIECPECFGDPALLLPKFYSPSRMNTQSKVVFIPNEGTKNDVQSILKLQELGFTILSMHGYNKWTDIIDEIANSAFVISESLHGLIVAETYGIPNIWVEFIEHERWWSFKFCDFYESIGKFGEESLKLYDSFSLEMITTKIADWKQGQIDYDTLLSKLPF